MTHFFRRRNRLSQLLAGLAAVAGPALSAPAVAQVQDAVEHPRDMSEAFDFVEAWGVFPFEGETTMSLLNDGSNCVPAANGLGCIESRVGLSLFQGGEDMPYFHDFGSLTGTHVRDLPLQYSYEEVDLSVLQPTLPDLEIAGTGHYQEGLVAGILTTPTGYRMPVSGVLVLSVHVLTEPEDISVGSVQFVPISQWYSLEAAMDAIDEQADVLWEIAGGISTDGETDGPAGASDLVKGRDDPDDCVRSYKLAKKACDRAYETEKANIENQLETCLDNVGFGDVVAGAGTYGGTGATVVGGSVAVYTWWTGPFSGAATTIIGGAAGVIGGIYGAFAGPADARDECRDTARNAHKNNANMYRDCQQNALDALAACLDDV